MVDQNVKVLANFNLLIEQIAEPEYREKWKVNVSDGSVAFGSARENWALSLPFMKKKGISFKDIYDVYDMPEDERKKWIWENAPLYEVVLDMVIKDHPDPVTAQGYRIPRLWQGDMESTDGKQLIKCDPNGRLFFVVTKVVVDPQAGEISAGRLFSGTMKKGVDVYLNRLKQASKIQQVFIYNGAKKEIVDEFYAGKEKGWNPKNVVKVRE